MLNSGLESRKSIAPYLAIPALRRVISTFANDPSGQFANWSTNPEVCVASNADSPYQLAAVPKVHDTR